MSTPNLPRVKILIIKGNNLCLTNSLEAKQRRRWSHTTFPKKWKWMKIGTCRCTVLKECRLNFFLSKQNWSYKNINLELIVSRMEKTKPSKIKKTNQAMDLQNLPFGSPTGVVHLLCMQTSKSFLFLAFAHYHCLKYISLSFIPFSLLNNKSSCISKCHLVWKTKNDLIIPIQYLLMHTSPI